MWAAVASALGGAALSGGTAWYSAREKGKADDRALDQMEKEHQERIAAQRAFEKRLNESADEIEAFGNAFITSSTKLDQDFDPYDMEMAFNSLYEAVIMPMERDFDESVLPGIRAAYSGGMMGAGSMLSGAAIEAEGSGRRDLAEKSADLRFQERDKAIDRNYTEYDRRMALFRDRYNVSIAPATIRAEQAPGILQSRNSLSDNRETIIGAQLSADYAEANKWPAVASAAYQGALGGLSGLSAFSSATEAAPTIGKTLQPKT